MVSISRTNAVALTRPVSQGVLVRCGLCCQERVRMDDPESHDRRLFHGESDETAHERHNLIQEGAPVRRDATGANNSPMLEGPKKRPRRHHFAVDAID